MINTNTNKNTNIKYYLNENEDLFDCYCYGHGSNNNGEIIMNCEDNEDESYIRNHFYDALIISYEKSRMDIVNRMITLNIIKFAEIFKFICDKNYLNFAKELFSKYSDLLCREDLKEIFTNCCKKGYLDMMEWLLTLEAKTIMFYKYGIKSYGKIDYEDNSDFTIACRNGHIHIAKMLFSLNEKIIKKTYKNLINPKPNPILINCHSYPKRYNYITAFMESCKYNQKEIVEWLCETGYIYLSIYIDGFVEASANGHINIVNLLDGYLEKVKKMMCESTIHEYTCNAFISSFENGHLELADSILKNYGKIIKCWSSIFYRLCENGELERLQWLYERKIKELIIIPIRGLKGSREEGRTKSSFADACGTGNIELVEWLISLEEIGTDYILEGFYCACDKYQIDMCDFLIKKGVEISNKNLGIIFRRSKMKFAKIFYLKYRDIIEFDKLDNWIKEICINYELSK
jgi:hypothetical protein